MNTPADTLAALADQLEALNTMQVDVGGIGVAVERKTITDFANRIRALASLKGEAVLEIGECAELNWLKGGPCAYAPGTKLYTTPPAPQAVRASDFDNWPDYNPQAMGCGLEDRNITDRYEAMRYGWDQALDVVADRLRDTPVYVEPAFDNPGHDKRFAAENLPTRPTPSPAPQGGGEADAVGLLREVCAQLHGVGCGPCVGSYAPMEDLHGRIAKFLGRKPDKNCRHCDGSGNADSGGECPCVTYRLTTPPAQPQVEVELLREALQQIADFEGNPLTPIRNSFKKSAIARAALAPKEKGNG